MTKKRSQKIDTPVIVALIGLTGTLITALVASPLVKSLVDRTPVPPTSPSSGTATIVFQADFENGQTSGFAFNNQEWNVVREKGNEVLELNGLVNDSGIATFGPNDFSNGRIEFDVNFKELDGFILNFRSDLDDQTYTLYFSTEFDEIQMGYGSAANNWDLDFFNGDSLRGFQINANTWYAVKLEAQGEKMTVWIDGNKILSTSDSRLTVGSMEFGVQGSGTVWIDNLKVWEY